MGRCVTLAAADKQHWDWVDDPHMPHSAEEAFSGAHSACLGHIAKHYASDLQLFKYSTSELAKLAATEQQS